MKTIFTNRGSRVWFIVTAALTAFFVLANILGQTVLNSLFITLFGKRDLVMDGTGNIYYTSDYENKDDAFEKANLLNERINEEGITLLKNENNALPLAKGSKISVFGKNSVNLAYGGSGSGAFTVDDSTPTLYDSLQKAGFSVNPRLKDFYKNNNESGSGRGTNPTLDNARGVVPGFGTGETPYSSYTQAVKDSYAEYSDAALIVITRIGGESFDLPRTMLRTEGALDEKDHYLELDKNEQDLIINVTAAFSKVILIINSSTSIELGFLDDIADNDSTVVEGMNSVSSKIEAAVWIGGPGYSGINALGRILNGDVNPSGKTIDTYQRDFTKDPTYQNFANNLKTNKYQVATGSEFKPKYTHHFLDYEEGIYVGYRYYETRGKDDAEWYKNNVVYPFGFGLSYTTFEWTVKSYSFDDGAPLSWTAEEDKEFKVTVNVKNTGSVAGKDVVQVYVTAPYTANGIEKPHVVLVGFAKTPLLAAGADADVEITFNGYDFASYDYMDKNNNSFCGYELDEGSYAVKVMSDAHTVKASASFVLGANVKYQNDTTTGTEVKNLYDDLKIGVEGGMESELSRNAWDTTFPVNEVYNGDDTQRTVSGDFMQKVESFATNNPIADQEDLQMPAYASSTQPDATKKIYDLILTDENGNPTRDEVGMTQVDYEDERWDEYLSTLTVAEMIDFTMFGAFQTMGLPSIDLLPAFVSDGPVGFVFFMALTPQTNPVYKTCSYASECVIAATWNVDLAYEMGQSVGNEGIIGNERQDKRPYSGWYAPAVNIHRTPFSGRNFEYYSEDPTISGKMAAQVIRGARSRGVYTQLKHFAVNDQETNRSGVCTWLTEQSLREIYLKPFEIAVKEGETLGVMSSFNRIGTLWTGGDYRLLTQILRNEWGFKGMVITDFNTESFMDTKQMTYAGGDLNLATVPKLWRPSTAADHIVLRNATKNVLYTTLRSNNMNGSGVPWHEAMTWWEITLIALLAVQVVACAVWGFFAIKKAYSKQ